MRRDHHPEIRIDPVAAALPAGTGEDAPMLVFAGPASSDGAAGAEVRTPPRTWFLDFLGRLPARVEYRELAGAGDAPPADDGDPQALAREARAYVARLAGEGQYVSHTEAVDAVRAGRHHTGGR